MESGQSGRETTGGEWYRGSDVCEGFLTLAQQYLRLDSPVECAWCISSLCYGIPFASVAGSGPRLDARTYLSMYFRYLTGCYVK